MKMLLCKCLYNYIFINRLLLFFDHFQEDILIKLITVLFIISL